MSNPNKVGVTIGALISGWHVLWLLLVLFGWAQSLLDFVFCAHMISPIYVVKPFDPKAAATLIIITFSVGYAFGFVGALLWNRLHRAS
jgi:hypothetical protein